MISFHISCHVADFSKSYTIKKFCWKNGLINYLWEYLYSKFKQESLLTASFLLLWEFFFFNIKSWQWYITCGNSVRRKRTRITMRSRVVLSVLFLRLDLMFVGPWIRVCERMSYEESKKQNILANISHRSWWHFNYIIMTFFRSTFDEMGENVEWFWLIWRIYALISVRL